MMFWLFAVLLLIIVLAVLLRPLLGEYADENEDGDRLNLSVYKQQLQELEADRERGTITEEQMERARMDIERAVLSEVPEEPVAGKTVSTDSRLLPPVLVSLVVIAVSVPVYLYIGYPQSLGGQAAADRDTPSLEEVEMMIAQLEQRLRQEPGNTQGWLMLARSYTALGRYKDAARTLERLRERIGDEPGLLVRLANALAMANNGQFEGRPTELIHQVLEQDSDNPSAVWFAGLAANQRGDYQEAIDYWEQLVPQLAGEPEALERLQALLARARNALPEQAAVSGDDEGTALPGIPVRVRLAPALQDRVSGEEPLYVFARAMDGTAMPLAVVRHRASELPLEVHLDDSQTMLPAARLSRHDVVTLVARISRTGSAQAESGDLQGEVTDVAVSTDSPVELVIDSPVP